MNYIEESTLVKQLQAWRDSAKKVEDRTISEDLAKSIMLIATNLLRHKRFVRYPQQDKDDMRQNAIVKCFKNLKNIDTKKGTVFSYITRTCWTAYIDYLVRYYKYVNNRRQLVLDTIWKVENEQTFPNIKFLQQLMGQLNSTLSQFVNKEDNEEN